MNEINEIVWDMNSITIHQGTGEDELEMTVQVTSMELRKMEQIREKNPSVWNGKELDLLKEAKKQLKYRRIRESIVIGTMTAIVVVIAIISNNPSKNAPELFFENTQEASAMEEQMAQTTSLDFGLKKIYNKIVKLGYKGTFDQFSTYFNENDENKRKVYDFNVKNGYKDSYEDFLAYAYQGAYVIENESRVWLYNTLTEPEYGLNFGTPKEFDSLLSCSEEYRRWLWEKVDQFGLNVGKNYEEFESVILDWESVLNDFIATKTVKPNLTKEEWFEKFPEFNNDEKLLQAAFDYDVTVKSGKYSDENELKSKFPEFWPNQPSLAMGENDKKRILYEVLSESYDLGSYDEYTRKLDIESKRRSLYDAASKKHDLGSWEEFNKELGYSVVKNPPQSHNAQNYGVQSTQWATFSIQDVCNITIPPSMELRDDNSSAGRLFSAINPLLYKMLCDDCDVFSDQSRIVFQPVGLNSDNLRDIDMATSTYARIIIEFGYNYDVSQDDIKSMTATDLVEYDEIIGKQYKSEFYYAQQAMGNTGTLVWHPVKRERIGEKYCLVLDYDRSGLQGMVKVKKYIFYYNDKEIDVTMSYRISEKGKYENDFEKAIKGLKIE